MTNRNKGQIKVGSSGSKVIGESTKESSTRIKVGNSGSIIIGKDNRESLVDMHPKKKSPKIVKKKIHPKKDQFLTFIEKEKKKEEKYLRKEREEKHLRKEREEKRLRKEREEGPIVVKFTRKIDEFNVLTQDNKVSGRPWYHGLDGDWWWGMTEEDSRKKLEQEQILEDRRDIDNDIEIEDDQEEDDIEIKDDQSIGDSKDIEDSQDIDQNDDRQKIEDIAIPETQIRTVSEMIDEMTALYSKDLPKDLEKRISYIYPLDSTHSFNIVAKNHIKYLKDKYLNDNKYIEIVEIDWSQLSIIDWNEKRNVLIHPFLYPFASAESFIQNSKNFARLLAMKNKIGGFDVADSDRISKPATDLINKIDLMMVPSNFARNAYIDSGVTIPVEVLPHGISDKFLNDDIIDTDNGKIMKLRKMKEKGRILILFFLIHSGHRKGADIVRRVMKRIQKKFDNVYLVVRSKDCDYFSDIRSICVHSWLNDDDLVALYDTCDICLSPSRGGGFELNALEAISRGVPTIVPNGGCFLDLIDYYIPIGISDKITQPLPGNPIHTGLGCEVDIDDFEEKLVDIINRLNYWKEIFKDRSKEIRYKYSWRNTAKSLDEYLRNYGFIE